MAKSATRLVSDPHQKEIARLLGTLDGKYNRWQLWNDFVTMSAVAISNAVDTAHFEEREKMYLSVVEKYTPDEAEVFSSMLAEVVDGLADNPERDFLGELFMALDLSNDWTGQFFTPYSVCECMAKMQASDVAERVARNGWVSVCDPAVGAGALLVAFANECLAQKVNYQQSVLFVAQDLDFTAACMCYITLSFLGCPGYVVVGDTLAHPAASYDRKGLIPADNGNVWYTPMYFSRLWTERRRCAYLDTLIHGMTKSEKFQPAG